MRPPYIERGKINMQILEMDNGEGTLVVRLSEHEIAIMDNTFSGLVGNETAVTQTSLS
jgi:hypothetical protein